MSNTEPLFVPEQLYHRRREIHARFGGQEQGPYLEPHHIRRLTDGGPDDPRWVAGICPNCHRQAHYSKDAVEYNTKLADFVQKLESHS